MANSQVIVDTGPLVALFSKKDQWHGWAVEALSQLKDPLITCDAVVSEASYLLSTRTSKGVEGLLGMLERGLLQSNFDLAEHLDDVARIVRKYKDLPTSFADACLVAMAERRPDARVFTVDQDFKAYRKRSRRVIPLLSPY